MSTTNKHFPQINLRGFVDTGLLCTVCQRSWQPIYIHVLWTIVHWYNICPLTILHNKLWSCWPMIVIKRNEWVSERFAQAGAAPGASYASQGWGVAGGSSLPQASNGLLYAMVSPSPRSSRRFSRDQGKSILHLWAFFPISGHLTRP